MAARGAEPFTEKAFYLAEFRARTLAIAGVAGSIADPAPLAAVLAELERNPTPVLLMLSDAAQARALDAEIVELPPERSAGALWRALGSSPRVALRIPAGEHFPRACRELAAAVGVPKLVFLDHQGALTRSDGKRSSFVDIAELAAMLEEPDETLAKRAPLLREVLAALQAGVPAVNLCTAEGLGDELFSYAGSGTLFTAERYVTVRRLGLDDLDAANDLLRRGVAEGYLAERSEEEVDRVFANGFGAFVEGRHLAGIGALIPHPESRSSEIASLYTLTRFLGEGIGGHLVAALLRAARERDDAFVFACTTSERVAEFFQRQGFHSVPADQIPDEKWQHYDPARMTQVQSLKTILR